MSEPREYDDRTVKQFREDEALRTQQKPKFSVHLEQWGDMLVSVQDEDHLPYNHYAWLAINEATKTAHPNLRSTDMYDGEIAFFNESPERDALLAAEAEARRAAMTVEVLADAPVTETVSPLAFIAETFALSLPAREAVTTINIEGPTQKENILKERSNRLAFTAQPFGKSVAAPAPSAPVQNGYSRVFIPGLSRRPVFVNN